jgi:hypothetical protein
MWKPWMRIFFAYPRLFSFFNLLSGVKTIDANVEAKTVIVEADESVTPQFMLEKLQKVVLGRSIILLRCVPA